MIMFATWIAAVAAVYLFFSLLAVAPRKVGYSHIRHTISELGEMGAPTQRFVAFGVFLPIGILSLVVAYLPWSVSLAAAALALCIAIGYLIAVAFPCDPGSPMSSGFRQAVHNVGGAVQYIGGGLALMKLAETLGQPFKVAGFVVLGTAVALTVLPSTSVRGIIQRIGETCLFGGLVLAAWWITGAA